MAHHASGSYPMRNAHQPSLRALWFGLFGAHVAWSVQMLVDYTLVAHSCFPAREPLQVPSISATWTIALGVSVAMLGVAMTAVVTALRSWRATRPEDERALLQTREDRTRFMALAGMLLSGLFTLAIIMNAVPLFMTHPCGQP